MSNFFKTYSETKYKAFTFLFEHSGCFNNAALTTSNMEENNSNNMISPPPRGILIGSPKPRKPDASSANSTQKTPIKSIQENSINSTHSENVYWGAQFSSFPNACNRIGGIVTSPIVLVLFSSMCLFDIGMYLVENLFELASGDLKVGSDKLVTNVLEMFAFALFLLILAPATIFINIIDVALGIINTIAEITPDSTPVLN